MNSGRIIIPEVDANILCCGDKGSSCGTGWLSALDDRKARFHRANAPPVLRYGPIVQQDIRRVSRADNDPVAVNSPKLDADRFVKARGFHSVEHFAQNFRNSKWFRGGAAA